ncbi:putative helicase [Catovirus CTV1]|mgnify:FL=1|uniref:Putative helicase n=1 Tax=Catovirus CTV1 TaxID=1977631 RepID=A0A1V0S8I4_9VIRU|nr:putative helicase [Catovirus CTV1]
MNIHIGASYEKYILEYLKNNEKYDNVWLWKDIPEKILYEEKIITDYAKYSLVRNDIGIDILAKKNNEYIYVQCKNYNKNSICVQDLAGYFFFKSSYKKNCKVYYNGNLSNRIKCIYADIEEFVQVPFNNLLENPQVNNDRIQEREYQLEAYNRLKDEKRSVVTLPCGMGKTYLSCLLAKNHDNIIFFCTNKRTLCTDI